MKDASVHLDKFIWGAWYSKYVPSWNPQVLKEAEVGRCKSVQHQRSGRQLAQQGRDLNQILCSEEGKQRQRQAQQFSEQIPFLIQSLNTAVIGGGRRKTEALGIKWFWYLESILQPEVNLVKDKSCSHNDYRVTSTGRNLEVKSKQSLIRAIWLGLLEPLS